MPPLRNQPSPSDQSASDRPGTALITGIGGQDGGYLAADLTAAGHQVHGIVRSADSADALRAHLPDVTIHLADLNDTDAMSGIVADVAPQQIYNLAGSTSVAKSWSEPVTAADVLGVGPIRLLAAAWDLQERTGQQVRFLQASSAEIFGDPATVPQSEATALGPVTPYGAAKAFAHEMVGVYRRRGLFACAAILYNHESPRRPSSFVARKITLGVANIALGRQDVIELGNIEVLRDWGYAPDYVRAMSTILAADRPDDYVVATGAAHTVAEFAAEAFAVVGISDWRRHIVINPEFYRPADPQSLVGDSGRLRSLGWQPTLGFSDLVRVMVEADLTALSAIKD